VDDDLEAEAPARQRDAWFSTWLSATSGQSGRRNFNRPLYSANTGLACGLKGMLWCLATDLMNPTTLERTERGRDIIKVNHELLPLGKIGIPLAIYSTPITTTPNNTPLPDRQKGTMPPVLGAQAFPKDW
jgi:hypothetical protein